MDCASRPFRQTKVAAPWGTRASVSFSITLEQSSNFPLTWTLVPAAPNDGSIRSGKVGGLPGALASARPGTAGIARIPAIETASNTALASRLVRR